MTMQTNDGTCWRDLRLVYDGPRGHWALAGYIYDLEYVGTTTDDAPRDEVATPARALEIARRILPSAVAVYSSMDDDPLGGWVVLLERLPADAGARSWEYAEVAEPVVNGT